MLTDPDALVRATAIGTVSEVLKLVEEFPLSDTNIVQEYILPALLPCRRDENDIVRQAFAMVGIRGCMCVCMSVCVYVCMCTHVNVNAYVNV
jgi:hypothetical protein